MGLQEVPGHRPILGGGYKWWHRKECYECGAPRPAKDPGDEVPRDKPGAIAPWEKNTKELENLKLRHENRRIQEQLDNLRNPPQAEDVPVALSDTEEAGIDDEDEEPLSADKEMNKLSARRNTLQNDLAGIKKASVSSELKKEQEAHIKRLLEECADKMRLAMPPHLKVAAARRRVAQSANIVEKL